MKISITNSRAVIQVDCEPEQFDQIARHVWTHEFLRIRRTAEEYAGVCISSVGGILDEPSLQVPLSGQPAPELVDRMPYTTHWHVKLKDPDRYATFQVDRFSERILTRNYHGPDGSEYLLHP